MCGFRRPSANSHTHTHTHTHTHHRWCYQGYRSSRPRAHRCRICTLLLCWYRPSSRVAIDLCWCALQLGITCCVTAAAAPVRPWVQTKTKSVTHVTKKKNRFPTRDGCVHMLPRHCHAQLLPNPSHRASDDSGQMPKLTQLISLTLFLMLTKSLFLWISQAWTSGFDGLAKGAAAKQASL